MSGTRLVIENIGSLCTMVERDGDPLGRQVNATVVVEGDRIASVAPSADAIASAKAQGAAVIDAKGAAVLPGFVDVHTHAVFAGDRADEFALRARGASYAEIMEKGGGIVATMAATRAASRQQLEDVSRPRLRSLLEGGVTTCEVKSGYGLALEHEVKTLQAARNLGAEKALPDVVPTFLGAHAVPPEFAGRIDAYVDLVVEEMLPFIAEDRLAERCDIFIEKGAFDVGHGRRVLEKARNLGLEIVAHVEQLSRSGGAALAAELGVRSVSHLEFINAQDIAALGAAGITAEILAGAQVFLGMDERIDGRALADAGCPIAIGTDLNPGSAHIFSLPLAAGFAVTNAGINAEEALRGMTTVAAQALGRTDRGRIEVGAKADIVVLNRESPYALLYEWGHPLVAKVIKDGRVAYEASGA